MIITETAQTAEVQQSESAAFSYMHDPRENPEAMKDIIENPDAVYGFSPDPESERLGSFADYDWTDPEGLAAAKESNLKTYGHEDGPTPDELFEKYGSWTTVLQKAFSPNMGMDACCGLYDEYYWLYIELGLVEE